MKLLLVVILLSFIHFSMSLQEIGDDQDDEDQKAEVIYNKTYVEQMTKLETDLFAKYNRLRRPVKNETKPLEVNIHYHVIHISVDEKEGILWLHGHLYMTWIDEYLGWDSTKYNGVRTTRTKKWQIWNPTLRIHNSASGAASSWDISRTAHVIINTKGESMAQVEVYPTMSIKVGCNFDFSDYPDDEQECSVRMYPSERMSEVQLKFYGDLQATVLLGWGDQATKKKVGLWEMVGTKNRIEYYTMGNYSTDPPRSPQIIARTWTVLETTITLRRFSPLFTYCFKLPSLISTLLTIVPFFLPNIHHAIVVLVTNILVQVVFTHELVMKIPLAVGSLPNTVLFYGVSLGWNGVCTVFHIICLWAPKPKPGTPILNPFHLLSIDHNLQLSQESWPSLLLALRTLFGLFSFFLFISLYFFLVFL